MEFPPVLCIVGASGSGKTSLVEKLIPKLIDRGLRVGTIKHDLRRFEMDKPGKDSWRHKIAGSEIAVISSPFQIGLIKDVEHDHKLEELLPLFEGMDIILAEGYKRENKPKLEVFSSNILDEPMCTGDIYLIAVITDTPVQLEVPTISMADIDRIAGFITEHFRLKQEDPVREEEKLNYRSLAE